MICEDCEEFTCSVCAKSYHRYHDWNTITTAARIKRRELKNTLGKTEEEDVKEMDKKIQWTAKQMEDNQNFCNSEVLKLQKHYDAIISKLNEIKNKLETKLRENLDVKNAEISETKSELEKERKELIDLANFLEENHGTMSDFSLIDNLRDLNCMS